ncbi:MAG: hypothetical protein GY750_09210 [Lentisphaerae bacterium]|nr:hypothetical protein [Lentisphaerota bacterium]MCP4101590.1 hypothetical protein [Lentisphaerota bacterium]
MSKKLSLKFLFLTFLFLLGSVLYAADFRFVQITDTHLGKNESQTEHLQSIIESINELPLNIRFVVHTGDILGHSQTMSNSESAKEARAIFKQLKPVVYFIPGNHDITPIDTKKSISNFETYFGPLFQKSVVEGVALYFVWADMNYDDVFLANYDPLACLSAEMAKTPKQSAIIFTHVPPDKNFYANEYHRGWKDGVKEKWIKALGKYNIIAMICGHIHRDQLQHLGKIPVYISSSATNQYARVPTYRIYHYKDGVLNYNTIYPKN